MPTPPFINSPPAYMLTWLFPFHSCHLWKKTANGTSAHAQIMASWIEKPCPPLIDPWSRLIHFNPPPVGGLARCSFNLVLIYLQCSFEALLWTVLKIIAKAPRSSAISEASWSQLGTRTHVSRHLHYVSSKPLRSASGHQHGCFWGGTGSYDMEG